METRRAAKDWKRTNKCRSDFFFLMERTPNNNPLYLISSFLNSDYLFKNRLFI